MGLFALWTGCDSSTSTPVQPPSSSPVPLVRVGIDTGITLVAGVPTTLKFAVDSGIEYTVSTTGTTDTRLQIADSTGKTLADDARPDSVNGLVTWKSTRNTTIQATVSGTGATRLLIRQTGGPDSLEPSDRQDGGARMVIGAAPILRTLTANDTDWFSFPAVSGKYYRIRSESDSNVLIQAWRTTEPRNSETGRSNVVLADRDTTIIVRVRLASKGQSGYGLSVSIDSTTFASTETNTWEHPFRLEAGSSWTAFYANSNKVDLVRFSAKPGRSYRLTVRSDVGVRTSLCTDSTRSDCTDAYSFVLSKAGAAGTMQATISANTYYRSWTSGEYLVRVAEDSSNLDKYEPDDTRASAQLLDSGESQKHLLAPYDKDWVKFHVDSGVSYLVESSASSTVVRAYLDSVHSVTDNVTIVGFKSQVTGWAWAQVNAFLGREDSGAYTISYKADRRTDAFEPDDTRETAKPYVADSAAASRYHAFPAGDVDWISFPTDSGKTYEVSLSASGSNAGFASYVYCGGSSSIASGWASNYRTDPIQFIAPKSGTCQVGVYGSYSWNAGAYSIQIR